MTENYEKSYESNELQQNQMICNERAKEYIRELNAERNRMDKKFPIADRLIEIGKSSQFSCSQTTRFLVRIDFPTFPSALSFG